MLWDGGEFGPLFLFSFQTNAASSNDVPKTRFSISGTAGWDLKPIKKSYSIFLNNGRIVIMGSCKLPAFRIPTGNNFKG